MLRACADAGGVKHDSMEVVAVGAAMLTAEWVKAHPYWQSKAVKSEHDAGGDERAGGAEDKPKKESKKSQRGCIITKQWLGRANCILAKLNQDQVRKTFLCEHGADTVKPCSRASGP